MCGKEITNLEILEVDLEKLLRKVRALGIPELATLDKMNLLSGDYINMEVLLPNGCRGRLLDDNKTYYANQVEKVGGDHCYGIAADGSQIALFEYGPGGADPILVLWIRY